MKIFRANKIDVYVPESRLEEIMQSLEEEEGSRPTEEIVQELMEGDIEFFFEQKQKIKEYCELYAKIHKLKPFAILDAHGSVTNKVWNYDYCGKDVPIQRWIDGMDGKYGTLLMNCCNESGTNCAVPTSKKSLLIFSNGETRTGLAGTGLGGFNFEFYIPKIGIVDNYAIEKELKQLKVKAKSQKAK